MVRGDAPLVGGAVVGVRWLLDQGEEGLCPISKVIGGGGGGDLQLHDVKKKKKKKKNLGGSSASSCGLRR